ncbi:MAG TPA: DUF971 domain-containing protein [Ignavibacteriaceae bacterium]
MTPKQIKVKAKSRLYIKWSDNTESEIGLKYLRDECPCASCKGETVLLKTYRPANKTTHPDMYQIAEIKQVGGYAIQITWKDGHNTGIYTWPNLKQLALDEGSGTSQNYGSLL